MRNAIIPRLGEYRCYVVKCDYKDANIQLFKGGKESIIKLIENAEDIPVKDIIDLYNVGDFDINKSEKIRSGFNGLDKWISGFVMGSLNIITGVNSSGKSTLLNQMCVAEPLKQGYKTFIFSDELQKEQLKSWILFTLAGPDNVEVFKNGKNQPDGYYLKKETKAKIAEWYKGKVFLYNNEEDNSSKNIIKKMVEMAKKYGVKNYILDNLMMVDIGGNGNVNDELKKQKEFVLQLKQFAKRYNSIVHLVAHPRKTEIIKRLTKSDVAGSGDITNLADYVLAVHRVLPSEKEGTKDKKGNYIVEPCLYDNIVDLFKNRHTGYQDKTIGLNFDMKSKRMYGESDDLNKSFGWNEEIEGIQEVEEVCPF
jgi:twinkle protein